MKQFYQEYIEKHNSPNRFVYREQEVLLVPSAAMLIVAGYINEDTPQQSTASKITVTSVNPITDKEQREELTNLLRKHVKNKDIAFWG